MEVKEFPLPEGVEMVMSPRAIYNRTTKEQRQEMYKEKILHDISLEVKRRNDIHLAACDNK